VKLAEVNKAELILLTVIGDLALTDEEMVMLRVSVDSVKEHNQRKIDAAKEKLQKLIRPSTVKRRRVQFMVRDGKPYAEIIRAAKDSAADLIVMSSHGHGRWPRFSSAAPRLALCKRSRARFWSCATGNEHFNYREVAFKANEGGVTWLRKNPLIYPMST